MARRSVQTPSAARTRSKSYAAPIGGWVSSRPLASERPGTARRLTNWFPTQTGVRPRSGTIKRATIASGSAVESMFDYAGSGVNKLFAATSSAVFDISSPADADTIPTALFTGRGSGYYVSTQISNVSGTYLYAVNGEDDALLYNGSTLEEIDAASTPAITGVATADLNSCWTYASRLFFSEKNTLKVHYLAVDAIGGALSTLTIAGSVRRGGSIVFGGTWSMDAGDGLDDKWFAVTTEGEVVVAEGTNPSDPSSFRIVGVYDIGKPLGPKAWVRVGGEILIATIDGLIPLSAATREDRSRLSLAAVSDTIEPDWRREANARFTVNRECLLWPEESMLLVSLPVAFAGQDNGAYVANSKTNAWCDFAQIDVNCMSLFGGRAYFGTASGTVHEFEATGSDDGSLYTCTMVLSDDALGSFGATKTLRQARATFRATHEVSAKLSASTDYSILLPSAPSSIADFDTSLWDAGLWDDAIWDAGRGEPVTKTTRWQSIGVTGESFLVNCQIALGITPPPDAELVTIDVTFEEGGLVV